MSSKLNVVKKFLTAIFEVFYGTPIIFLYALFCNTSISLIYFPPTFSKSYAVVDYFKIPSDIDVHNLYFAITLKLFP